MTTVLLTGFEPFDGEATNPSWEMVRGFDNQMIGDSKIIARCLPCVFGASLAVLEQAIIEVQPDVVISFGQAGGRTAITPERVAINIDDARICDNIGNQPIDIAVIADAPAAYFSTLPIKAMVQALQMANIPAMVSNTAGTFVCNHVFFGLQHLGYKYGISKSGFVHIPYLPEQVANQPLQPSMALSILQTAVETMLPIALSTTQDINITGGQTH